jgi:hypothetical protein
MNVTRRVFFSALLFARSTQTSSLRVVVLETFGIGGVCTAALVHHAEPATRDRFAQWLRSHPRNAIRVRSKTGEEVSATIFRVRMCFGRGLILLEKPIPIRERDVLTVVG